MLLNISLLLTVNKFINYSNFVDFSGGKRDERLILPLNDSISVTLSTDYVRTQNEVFCHFSCIQFHVSVMDGIIILILDVC